MRTLCASLAMTVIVASAAAQLTGPAPLAWRWYQPTSVSPAGSPLVNGDTIYFSVGNRVNCIDRTSGNLRWRFPAVEPINGAFRAAPLLSAGTLVAVADNQTIYGIDPNNGSLKWTYDMPGRAIGPAVIAGKFVAVAQADNKIVAVDPATGKAAWDTPITIHDGIMGSIGSNDDDILVFNQRFELFSISTISKKTTWSRPFSQIASTVTPVKHAGTVYVNSGPYLIALNALTGRPRWQRDTRATELAFAPSVSATTILTLSRDGQAMAYDLNGNPINKTPINLGSFPATQPTVVSDSHFVVATTNGAINLIDPTYVAPETNDPKKPKVDPRDAVILARVDAPSPDLLWSFVIPPVTDLGSAPTTPGGMPGGMIGGGPGGLGGMPGGSPGGMPGGMPGMGNRPGQTGTSTTQPTSVQAAAPAVLAGSTLLVPAKDGSLLAFDKTLGVDLTAPTVKMLWPNSGEQVSGKPPLELQFQIEDEATGVDVRSLEIKIGDQPYEYSYTRDGYAIVRFSTIGANKPLVDGRKQISVTVADWAGNKRTYNYSLLIDNSLPPLAPTTRPTTPGMPGGRPGGGPGRGGPGGGFGGAE